MPGQDYCGAGPVAATDGMSVLAIACAAQRLAYLADCRYYSLADVTQTCDAHCRAIGATNDPTLGLDGAEPTAWWACWQRRCESKVGALGQMRQQPATGTCFYPSPHSFATTHTSDAARFVCRCQYWTSDTPADSPVRFSGKKGCALGSKYAEHHGTMSDFLGCSWYHNWGSAPSASVARIPHFPNFWNGQRMEEKVDAVCSSYRAGRLGRYIFTFNEPTLKGQSNMQDPVDAAAVWLRIRKQLDESCIDFARFQLVAPCAVDNAAGRNWTARFVASLPEQTALVYCLHFYPAQIAEADVAAWSGRLTSAFSRFSADPGATFIVAETAVRNADAKQLAGERSAYLMRGLGQALEQHPQVLAWAPFLPHPDGETSSAFHLSSHPFLFESALPPSVRNSSAPALHVNAVGAALSHVGNETSGCPEFVFPSPARPNAPPSLLPVARAPPPRLPARAPPATGGNGCAEEFFAWLYRALEDMCLSM